MLYTIGESNDIKCAVLLVKRQSTMYTSGEHTDTSVVLSVKRLSGESNDIKCAVLLVKRQSTMYTSGEHTDTTLVVLSVKRLCATYTSGECALPFPTVRVQSPLLLS